MAIENKKGIINSSIQYKQLHLIICWSVPGRSSLKGRRTTGFTCPKESKTVVPRGGALIGLKQMETSVLATCNLQLVPLVPVPPVISPLPFPRSPTRPLEGLVHPGFSHLRLEARVSDLTSGCGSKLKVTLVLAVLAHVSTYLLMFHFGKIIVAHCGGPVL